MNTFETPKKRDWLKGFSQIGVFWRTKEGSTISMVHDRANSAEETLVAALVQGVQRYPLDVIEAVRKAGEKLKANP